MDKASLTQRVDKVKQTLEEAAATGSRQTFHNAISTIDWEAASPEQFILVIDLALELGDTKAAREFSARGSAQFPDDETLQRAAEILAPPTASINDQTPVEGLDDSINWFARHAGKYKGRWVAVRHGQLIGVATSRRDLAPILKPHDSSTDILIARVP